MAGQFGGFAKLGSALTGGGQLPAALAEAQGTQLGANTENAIAEAQARQQKTEALKNIGNVTPDLAAATQDPTKLGAVLAAFAQAGVNPETFAQSVGVNQHNNSYNQIVNPETSDEIVSRHLVAEGKPGIIHQGAQGEYTNALHPGVPQVTPLGQTLAEGSLALKKAQTDYYNSGASLKDRTPSGGAGGAGGVKPPSGYQWAQNPDGTPALDDNGQQKVTPLTGGNKDPDAPHAMGANQTAQFLRTINSARQGATDLSNVMQMNVGASTGIFGSGIAGSQGHSLGGTVAANLSNALNGQDAQQYNVVMSGLNQNLSTLETFGLAPRGALVGSMDRLAITPTDTEGTALIKLAQARQIVEQALNTHVLDNPNLSEKQKGPLRQLQADITGAIPFTVQDVLHLQQSKAPQATLGQLVQSRGLGTPTAVAPAGAAPAAPVSTPQSFASEADAEAADLEPGTRITIGGRPATWQ